MFIYIKLPKTMQRYKMIDFAILELPVPLVWTESSLCPRIQNGFVFPSNTDRIQFWTVNMFENIEILSKWPFSKFFFSLSHTPNFFCNIETNHLWNYNKRVEYYHLKLHLEWSICCPHISNYHFGFLVSFLHSVSKIVKEL